MKRIISRLKSGATVDEGYKAGIIPADGMPYSQQRVPSAQKKFKVENELHLKLMPLTA